MILQRTRSKAKVPSLHISNKENESSGQGALNSSSKKVSRESSRGKSSTSVRRKNNNNNNKSTQHRFQKKIFPHPTWCQYANKFIWGLDKSGYECRVCGVAVSRQFIAVAKNTSCGEGTDVVDTVPIGKQIGQTNRSKIFTIYLPHGAKKSIILHPTEKLKTILSKVCFERGINISEYVAEDTNGAIVDLDTTLGNISGAEITFTKKESKDDLSPILREKKSIFPDFRKARSKSSALIERPSRNTSSRTNTPRRSVLETYEIGKELGSGAFSVVKSATHKDTQEVVAIKILDKYEEDDEQTQKFKQEIKIISSLMHENIVQFYELDEDDDNFYVVMELVGGGELFDHIIDCRVIPELEAVSIVTQVCKAIEYMHSEGTVHRDLKPENLLFTDNGHKVIKIADFGESKSFKEGQLNTYCGTPDYMAPEIIRGDPYGPEVDIWAIGVITYVILAGFPPFDGENDVEVFASILAIRYDFPSPEWDKISSEAKNFIQSILVDAPSQRLTAADCLQHPWITNNIPLEVRTNVKPQEKLKRYKSDKSIEITIPPLDLKRPKSQLKEITEDLCRMECFAHALPELKVIQVVIESTSGKTPLMDVEKVIYQTYHRRLQEIVSQRKIKKSKK